MALLRISAQVESAYQVGFISVVAVEVAMADMARTREDCYFQQELFQDLFSEILKTICSSSSSFWLFSSPESGSFSTPST